MDWRQALLDWFRDNRRDLPWRRNKDVYPVWVSEVMLQQTQVATVAPYFERWMARFPDLEALSKSSEEDVLALWQGMGYYRRAKQLRAGAAFVLAHGVPASVEAWLQVPGVGRYTASAIGSIAQNLPVAVVDGNVERVFARFTAHGGSGENLLRAARNWAQAEMDRTQPGDWNQAMMDLGATVCTPRLPSCGTCPLEFACVARQSWTVDRYPAAVPARPIIKESHVVWAPYFDGRFGVRKISEGRWWAGMWEFPRSFAGAEDELRSVVGEGWLEYLGAFSHQVTNHRIQVDASLVRCDSQATQLSWRTAKELDGTPLPSPQRKVLRLALKALGVT